MNPKRLSVTPVWLRARKPEYSGDLGTSSGRGKLLLTRKKNKQKLNAKEEPLPEGFGTVAIFEVAGRVCAVPTRDVQEVVLLPDLAKPPGLPTVLEGFMSVGSSAIAVVRLDRLFGFEETKPNLYTPILILRGQEPPVAFLVARVREVLSLRGMRAARVEGGGVFNDCLVGEIRINDEVVHLLDPSRVLLAEEQTRIQEFHARSLERMDAWEEAGS